MNLKFIIAAIIRKNLQNSNSVTCKIFKFVLSFIFIIFISILFFYIMVWIGYYGNIYDPFLNQDLCISNLDLYRFKKKFNTNSTDLIISYINDGIFTKNLSNCCINIHDGYYIVCFGAGLLNTIILIFIIILPLLCIFYIIYLGIFYIKECCIEQKDLYIEILYDIYIHKD